MKNKIVIFDWGGVILHEFPDSNNSKEAIIRTIKKYNNKLSDEEIYNIYLKSLVDENGINISTQNDEKSKIDWVNRIAKGIKANILYEDFINDFSKEYQKTHYYKDVVKYIYSLKEKCKIGIFSNLIFACYDTLKNQVDLSKFDYVWLSYEIHNRKPDEDAYIQVEKDLSINPKDILFIDDKPENTKVAKMRGWNICCAKGYELDKIKQSVDNFLT